ncbi:MAG: Hsp20/alpha crystallin family protein [Nitrospinae bacterium]|nr:Hsp20/alpha crystallin family protein [Nitrospinota bacterium]
MFNTSLLPWRKKESSLDHDKKEQHPFLSLQDDMNRAFDNFFKEFKTPSFGSFDNTFKGVDLKVNVNENDKDIVVTAELPGVNDKDIDIEIKDNFLVLKGEKKEEKEEEKDNSYYKECSYGSFYRTIPLSMEVDEDKVDASFKNGVLTVTLPKSEEAKQKIKKITVKSS